MTTFVVRAFTDVGLTRARNEDALLVGGWHCQAHSGVLATMRFDLDAPVLFAVADGMGGHAGGHLASSLSLNLLSELAGGWNGADDIAAALAYVNDQIRDVGKDPDLQGLGTTVAGLWVAGAAIVAFNIGDSRIYTIDDGFLQQISTDDSVHDAYGNTTNFVTQSVGQPNAVNPHIVELPLQQGSFLLCSDGVSGAMPVAELRSAVLSADTAACSRAIIESTRCNGADDNFSFLFVEVSDVPSPEELTDGETGHG